MYSNEKSKMRQLKITSRITNRDGICLDKYLSEISKFSLLSPEKEVEIAKKARSGEKQAVDLLVVSNLKFVVSIAKQYQNQGLSISDLINEGNIGLMIAAERFDETRGFKFISYAVWWIRQSIVKAIQEQTRIVRMPANQFMLMDKVTNFSIKFEMEHFREISDEEVADIFHIKKENLPSMVAAYKKNYASLDVPLSEDGNTLLESIADTSFELPDEILERVGDKNLLVERIKMLLTPKQADVLGKFFGLEGYVLKSLEDIGLDYNLSQERIRQIKDKAIKRLKRAFL